MEISGMYAWLRNPCTWGAAALACFGGVWWYKMTASTSNLTVAGGIVFAAVMIWFFPWVSSQPPTIRFLLVILAATTIAIAQFYLGFWSDAQYKVPPENKSARLKSEQGTPAASRLLDPVEVVSLYRLFKEDVPGVKSVDFLPLRVYLQHSNSVLSVEPRLHADFVGLSKFVSFYVPSSPYLGDVIRFIADNYIELTGIDKIELVLTKPGEYPQSTDGMKFTGSIVIYHEDALSNADLAKLEDYYHGRQLTPIWRGTGYVQTQILLRNNREALVKLAEMPPSMAAPADQSPITGITITGITAGVNGELIRIKNKAKAVTPRASAPDTGASPH